MSLVRRALDWSRNELGLGRIGKFLAAIVVGLGIGAAVPPDPMTLPAVGTVPSLVVGGTLVAVGAVAFTKIPTRSGCGCSGDCNCS